jgi:glycosyltransferase involved in cell wall biosynthesis
MAPTDGNRPLRVMQLIDSLALGGAEQMAVAYANELAARGHHAHLCATRDEGPLRDRIAPDVGFLALHRRRRLDLGAIRRLARYLRRERIDIVHAHSTSILTAVLARLLPPFARVVWQDHSGKPADAPVPRGLKPLVRRAHATIAVQAEMLDWARSRLGIAARRSVMIPNFVPAAAGTGDAPDLPGSPESRIVCVANLRPVKDHFTLARAAGLVRQRHPNAVVLCVGAESDPATVARLRAEIADGLPAGAMHLLGARTDVAAILGASAIGVLTSASEGLPMALLEYGRAGLAVVSTAVGECPRVLGNGRYGRLVPPGDPAALADALIGLLTDADARRRLGAGFQAQIAREYSPAAVMQRVVAVYRDVLAGRRLTDPTAQ